MVEYQVLLMILLIYGHVMHVSIHVMHVSKALRLIVRIFLYTFTLPFLNKTGGRAKNS